MAPSGPHTAPAQARPLPWRRARKAWVGCEGGGIVVGLAAGTGEVSSRAPERHPGGCSGLQSMESEGARVLESPGAMLWHQQQKLSKEGGPCTHLWGRKGRWWLKQWWSHSEPRPAPRREPGEKRRPTFTTSPRRALHSFKMTSKDSPGGPAVRNPPCNAEDVGSTPGWGTRIPHPWMCATHRSRHTVPGESACLNKTSHRTRGRP